MGSAGLFPSASLLKLFLLFNLLERASDRPARTRSAERDGSLARSPPSEGTSELSTSAQGPPARILSLETGVVCPRNLELTENNELGLMLSGLSDGDTEALCSSISPRISRNPEQAGNGSVRPLRRRKSRTIRITMLKNDEDNDAEEGDNSLFGWTDSMVLMQASVVLLRKIKCKIE